MTVRSLLEELSQRAVDEALLEQAGARMADMRDSDPQAWADYLREGAEWEQGTIDRVEA